jgi:hypothetical protein
MFNKMEIKNFKKKSTCLLASIVPTPENFFQIPLGRTWSSCCSCRRSRGESLILLRFLHLIYSCILSSHLYSCASSHLSSRLSSCASPRLSSLSFMSGIFFFSLRIYFSISDVHSSFLFLLVIGPMYFSIFNSRLSLLLFNLIFCFFGLVFHLFFVFEEFLFLLELVFPKIFLVVL